jgi:hypothetical protein
LITDTVRDHIDDRYSLHEMKPMPVIGKKEPIITYYVKGKKGK